MSTVAEERQADRRTDSVANLDTDIRLSETPLLKCAIDIVGSISLIILFAPLILCFAIMIGLDGGPIFYSDERLGQNGRRFKCYKLRTMRMNSEKILAEVLARDTEAHQEWIANYKLKNDPRIIRIGRFLRASSFDELPQLWNVLCGDMSIVGPRPIPVAHNEARLYGRYIEHYFSARPGMTGIWQVSGRNSMTYRRRVATVVYYARHWSIGMDLILMLRTIKVIFSMDGW